MECRVCKKDRAVMVEIEQLSEEIPLCETCLDDYENGELEGAVKLVVANDDSIR